MKYLSQKNQTKGMTAKNYQGLRCHLTYDTLERQHDNSQVRRNKSHLKRH